MVLGQPVFNPIASHFPKFGIAFLYLAEPSAERAAPGGFGVPLDTICQQRKAKTPGGQGLLRSVSQLSASAACISGISVPPHAAGPYRIRPASAIAVLRNKFALCLGP